MQRQRRKKGEKKEYEDSYGDLYSYDVENSYGGEYIDTDMARVNR